MNHSFGILTFMAALGMCASSLAFEVQWAGHVDVDLTIDNLGSKPIKVAVKDSKCVAETFQPFNVDPGSRQSPSSKMKPYWDSGDCQKDAANGRHDTPEDPVVSLVIEIIKADGSVCEAEMLALGPVAGGSLKTMELSVTPEGCAISSVPPSVPKHEVPWAISVPD